MSNDIPDSNPFPQRRMSARLNCPHCHNPIELVADSVDEDVLCPSCGSAVHVDSAPMLTWDKKKLPALGQFQLIEAVGRGAFGTVYKAFDQQLQRTVAVKIPRSGVLETDEDEDRFVREARNVAQLRHPGIVAIHSVGRSDAFPYLVSEFVEGVTLSEYLTAKRFSIKESARLIREICIALQHAHSQGVVHRDLKPSNIMLTPDGQPRIMDFGVAKRNAGEITMTIDGQILGTPAYMSPEQAGGLSHQADAQSDIYSVGVILFQLLTGELPFRGDVQMLLYQVQYEEPPSPRKLNHQVPRDLETICLKCMAKEPKRRYASAGDLADDVQRYLDGIPILARPVTRIEHAWRWCRRNSVIAALSSATALLLTLTAATAFVAYVRESRLAEANGRLATDAKNAREKAEQLASNEKVLKNDALALAEQEREARKQAEINAELTRRHLYGVHMKMAQEAWEQDHTSETVRLLEIYRQPIESQGKQVDLRGFEWYYLDRLCNSELFTLKGHKNEVRNVAFTPDGRQIASAGPGEVKIWNATTGEEQSAFYLGPKAAGRTAFSPNGRHLASSSINGVFIWDLMEKDIPPMLLSGNAHFTAHITYSPDGEWLASSSYDRDSSNTIQIRNAKTGNQVVTLKGHIGNVHCIKFSPDGSLLASTSLDHTLKVWDTTTGLLKYDIQENRSDLYCIAFSSDGRWLASANGFQQPIKIWDVTTGLERLDLEKGGSSRIQALAYSPDGQLLASAESTNINIRDAWTCKVLFTLRGHTADVRDIAYSADGQRIVSASADGTIKIWNATGIAELKTTIPFGGRFAKNALSADGCRFASVRDIGDSLSMLSNIRRLRIWDTANGDELFTRYGNAGSIVNVAYSPDGKSIATASEDYSIQIWDTIHFTVLTSLIGHKGNVNSLGFSQDGRKLVSASDDSTLKIWETSNATELFTLTGHQGPVNGAAFNPDGRQVVSAGLDHSVKIWDATNGARLFTLKGHRERVHDVAFSPDGQHVVSASSDKTLKIWDASTGIELFTLNGHMDAAIGVSYSPDGKRIVSVSSDKLLIWDATTRIVLFSLDAGEFVAFSADGKRMATFDRKLRSNVVYDVRNDSEVPNPSVRRTELGVNRVITHHNNNAKTEKELKAAIHNDRTIGADIRLKSLEAIDRRRHEKEKSLFALRSTIEDVEAQLELNFDNSQVRTYLSSLYKDMELTLDNESQKIAAQQFNQRRQELLTRIITSSPDDDRIQEQLYFTILSSFFRLVETGQQEAALDHFQRLRDISQRATLKHPDVVDNHHQLQYVYSRMGKALVQFGRWQESVEYFEKDLELAQANSDRFPRDRQCKVNLYWSHTDLGEARIMQARIADAIDEYGHALALAKTLSETDPDDVVTVRILYLVYHNLGNAVYQRFRFIEARKLYEDGLTALDAFSSRTKLTTFEAEIKGLKQNIEICDRVQRSILDLDFACAQDKTVVSQYLVLRLQAFLAYANTLPEEIPADVREKWSTGILTVELFREAIRTAEAHRALEPPIAATLYDAACGFSLCLKGLNKHDVPEKESLASQLQSKALETLKAAIAAGWNNVDHTAADTDLEPLRELPEFKTMLEELRAKPK